MKFRSTSLLGGILISFTLSPIQADPGTNFQSKLLSASQIVSQCDNKYAGKDQITKLSVTVKNKFGNEQKTIYKRFWKSVNDNSDASDKLSLFTVSPPDAKNTVFLQHSFKPNLDKNAEQWIYLPTLRKVRRTTVRDLSDSFLGTDLTFDDIRIRYPKDDFHKLISTNTKTNKTIYIVESKPKENNSIYSKKIVHYEMSNTDGNCLKKQITYFDKNHGLIKKQTIDWQQIDNAWLWKKVEVKNAQTFGSTLFEVSQAKVNVGVPDKWFNMRMLRRGL